MKLVMSGLEHDSAPIELRERLSFTKAQTIDISRKICADGNVSGCVLISTCNRTELYVSCTGEVDPAEVLCRAAGAEDTAYRRAFVTRREELAADHLMRVAAGLRSRIWGEDQIISQVKNAIALAREAGTADSMLETLFRSAVAAGKEIRSKVRLTALPTSAASMAVAQVEDTLGTLDGKRGLVIGNGEMGRLAASLLEQAGCQVNVTLRTYRHGETVVPPGCGVVAYEDRFVHMDGIDLVISATTSPHYTVAKEQFDQLCIPPRILVDLAIPRDIQPEIGEIPGVELYNVDDLGNFTQKRAVPPEVEQIIDGRMEQFYRWVHYKDCLGSKESLKQALMERILACGGDESASREDIAAMAVDKTVELLLGGLSDCITPERLNRCEQKIRSHTVAHHSGT